MARFLDLYGGCLRDSPQKRRPGKALPGHRKFPVLILKSLSLYLWKWKLQITNLEHSLSSADILKAQRFAETAFQFHNVCEKGAKKSQPKCMNHQNQKIFLSKSDITLYIFQSDFQRPCQAMTSTHYLTRPGLNFSYLNWNWIFHFRISGFRVVVVVYMLLLVRDF